MWLLLFKEQRCTAFLIFRPSLPVSSPKVILRSTVGLGCKHRCNAGSTVPSTNIKATRSAPLLYHCDLGYGGHCFLFSSDSPCDKDKKWKCGRGALITVAQKTSNDVTQQYNLKYSIVVPDLCKLSCVSSIEVS